MKLSTYLNFGGRCEDAFRFYARHLNAEITAMMTFRDGPPEAADQVPADWRDKIMHASLEIDGQLLMGTDGGCTEHDAEGIKGVHVVLHVDEPQEAERVYAVLSEGGTVEMPMEETFFAHRFGMVVDPFGTPWMVICEKSG